MWILLAVVLSLVFYGSNAAKVNNVPHHHIARQIRIPASMVYSVYKILAFSIPTLKEPSSRLITTFDRALYSIIRLIQNGEPVPSELTTAITGLFKEKREPADIFESLRNIIDSQLTLSHGKWYIRYIIRDLESLTIPIERLFHMMSQEDLYAQIIFTVPSDRLGTIDLPGSVLVADKKYVLSGAVVEDSSGGTKMYYSQPIPARIESESCADCAIYSIHYELRYTIIYKASARPRLIVYTEENFAKILATPPSLG